MTIYQARLFLGNEKLMEIQKLLQDVIKREASDLHIVVGTFPTLRIDGKLKPIEGTEVITPKKSEALVFALMTDEQKELLLNNKEVDFSFALGESARFRVNAYYQKGYISAALRYIPMKIQTMDQLGLPKICQSFSRLPQGLILVTGPTGHGKSTTLASIIDEINMNREGHIITIEDPIEYVFSHKRCVVTQRELHLDTHSFDIALRSALREDPDVVLIGEMRDYETISAALTIAETGHLVFATLHTNNAAQTIDRIVDVFPEHQQAQVCSQLSSVLEGIISQRLIPAIGGGRVLANEIMFTTSAVRNLIRDRKPYQIDNIIATSFDIGMMSLERSLVHHIKAGKISLEDAKAHTLKPEEIIRMMKTEGK